MNQSGFTVYPVGLHVRNAGTERLVGRLHDTPVCTYWVQLYWTSARSVPVWPPPAEAEPAVCAGTNTEFEIESGGEESVSNATRFTNGLVGDSLPEGWYHPTLTIAPFGVLTELKVDSVHLMPR